MLNNIEHYDLYKIFEEYRENNDGLADYERLIGEYIEKAVEKGNNCFEESGLLCPITGELILEPVRIIYDDDSKSRNVFEYHELLKWWKKEGGNATDPCTRRPIKDLCIDEEIRRTIKDKLWKCFDEYYYELLGNEKRGINEAISFLKLMRFIECGDYYQVLQCLNDGVNINAQNNNNQTPLHMASLKGMASIVKLLLERGAKINIQDNQGETALHYASYYSHYATVEILLKKGAKINTQGNLGKTALHHAAFANNVGMIKFLLEAGAKANAKDNFDRTPLSFTDNKEMITLLRNKQIIESVVEGNDNQVLRCLNDGADVNAKNDNKKAILHMASLRGMTSIVELLLKNGVDINTKNNQGNTALHFASYLSNNTIVTFPLKREAKADVKDNKGETTLHFAFYNNYSAIVELLLENGADINIQDHLGRTALHYVTSANNADMVELLLKAGAEANIKDNDGRKPSSFTKNKEIIGLFENPPARCLSDVMVSCLSTPPSVFCGK
ncbi:MULTISPECIES: ankyrin repeat domain-containing protein [unclassified Wolbachia]|uniref:ankyrin repeat domain-containing protein n=1 Tax=unclassified Wolbachia TaxID=2640676 RepID=UPI00222E532F|nr:ankyrin repeat domain-containing protein [Wolbachia endosymbiont (group A) of Apoderus coryli]